MNENTHKRMYDDVRKLYPTKLPAWEDLPAAQKALMRAANAEYIQYMHTLARDIRRRTFA